MELCSQNVVCPTFRLTSVQRPSCRTSSVVFPQTSEGGDVYWFSRAATRIPRAAAPCASSSNFTQVVGRILSSLKYLIITPCPPSLSGPVIISERSSDWSVVRRMGTQVFPAANGLLHMCTHSTDEDQPMVSAHMNHTPHCGETHLVLLSYSAYVDIFLICYQQQVMSSPWWLNLLLQKNIVALRRSAVVVLLGADKTISSSFRWYFAVISMSGVFAVTFSVIFAYVADITQEHERSTAYGLVRRWLTTKLIIPALKMCKGFL